MRHWLALAAGFWALAPAAAAYEQLPPAKTIFESSFENGENWPAGWEAKASPADSFHWVDSPVRTGKRAVHIVDTSKKQSAGLRSRKVPVKPGQRLWVKAWFLSHKPGGVSVYVECWDAKGRRLKDGVRSFGARSSGQWTQIRGTLIAPPNAARANVLLYCWSGGTCDGYFDDVAFGAGFQPPFDRTPRPAAKVLHPCGPYSAADIERAKKNVEKHQWARDLLKGFKSTADFWMRIPDDQIKLWLPERTPFRVVNCPNCGANWAICWRSAGQGKFKCRKCGLVLPNDKFKENKTEVLLTPTGKLIPHHYYEGADGKKYRISGKVRLSRVIELRRLGAMGRYYALTGDIAYARKAVKVMRRLAEVYPDWAPHDWHHIYQDYRHTQAGKMSGWKLSDCAIMLEVCLCYDLIYNSGALTEDDKAAIENRVFRELGELLLPIPQRGCCINDGPFQMSAAAYLGAILGDHRLVKWAVAPPGGFIGFVRDYFFRDGHWEDGSPSYEAMALSKFYLLPEILQGYSDPPTYTAADRYDKLDVLSEPLMKKILIASLYDMFPDRTLPPINDSAKGCGYSGRHAEVNYFWYPTQRNLEILNWVYKGDIGSARSEYALWRRDPDADFSHVGQLCLSDKSLLQPGLGWAILRQGAGADRTDLVLDYGPPCGWHGHPDRLNFLLWANGREVVTDLGYLGARHHFRPWMAHGVCHNLVMVDGKDQARQPGKLILFQPGERVQAIVAQAPKTYPQCSRYERALVLVTPAAGVQYVVDVFRVAGGGQHDYSFHGDGLEFACPALKDAKPFQGKLGPKGGGYDWFEDVKIAPARGEIVADWRFGDADRNASDVGVRLRMIDASGELIDGKAPNLRNTRTPYLKPMLDFLIQRRRGPANTFVAVVEPVEGRPVVQSAGRLPVQETKAEDGFGAVAVKITHPAGVDYVLVAANAAAHTALKPDDKTEIALAGRLGVVSFDADGAVRFLWLADGASLRCNGVNLEVAGAFAGKIAAFDEKAATFDVDAGLPEGAWLSGQPLIAQARCDGAYTVDRVERIEAGSRVHLRNEPVMKVKKGEAFRLPTYGLLLRKQIGKAATLWRIASATPAKATVPRRSAAQAFVRAGAGAWQRLDAPQRSRTLDIASNASPRTRVLLTNRAIAANDTTPPAIESVEPASRKAGALDLGFVRAGEIVITASDRSGVAACRASLVGKRSGRAEIAPKLQPVAGKPELTRIAAPIAQLPDDDFTLRVAFCDALGNESAQTIAFQTLGLVKSFMDMKVVADSGQDSKPLRGLGTQFYRAKKAGDFVEYEFGVERAGTYGVSLISTQAQSYGTWQLSIDGQKVGAPVDGYAGAVKALAGRAQLGTIALCAGAHRVRLEVVGRNEMATACFVGLGQLVLKPQ